MLKWTLRAIAALAIVAAITTPVAVPAVPAPEAAVATPAVTTAASALEGQRAELASAWEIPSPSRTAAKVDLGRG